MHAICQNVRINGSPLGTRLSGRRHMATPFRNILAPVLEGVTLPIQGDGLGKVSQSALSPRPGSRDKRRFQYAPHDTGRS